jgi:hypothetical protein
MPRNLLAAMAAGVTLMTAGVLYAVPAGATTARPDVIGTSQGFAGYDATTKSTATTLALNLTVPKITCTKPFPKNPLYLTADLQGTVTGGGPNASGFQVYLACSGKTPVYEVYLLVDGEYAASMAVKGGNALTYSGSASASSESYTATDTTTSTSITADGSGLSTTGVNLWAQNNAVADPNFPPFKTMEFSAIAVNGAALSTLKPSGFSDVDGSNNVLIQTGKLTAEGTAFKLTYVSND